MEARSWSQAPLSCCGGPSSGEGRHQVQHPICCQHPTSQGGRLGRTHLRLALGSNPSLNNLQTFALRPYLCISECFHLQRGLAMFSTHGTTVDQSSGTSVMPLPSMRADWGCSLLLLPTRQLLASASNSALCMGQFVCLLLHLQNRSPHAATSLRFRSAVLGLHPSVWSIAYIFNLSIISPGLGQSPMESSARLLSSGGW